MNEQEKFSYLDEFKIIRNLGSGYHAQVKLATDSKGAQFAIKRYKQTANLQTLNHQLDIMKELKHQNIVQLVDVRTNAIYKHKDQTTYNCFAIILEYVGGGELFDFIAETGRFSDKLTRTYFAQMLDALIYMHDKGYSHRDIKPENILLAKDFKLKLADFGFSCLSRGKDNSGILHTKLGTEGYMAPQISSKNYVGTQTDVFAAGVILFIMYAGTPPFETAGPNDPYYRLLKQKQYGPFWKAHSRRKPAGYFCDDFKDLFQKACAYEPKQRPDGKQLLAHPWMKKEACSEAEVNQQMKARFKELDEIMYEKRKEEEQKRQKHTKICDNLGKSRGNSVGIDEALLTLYQNQQEKERVLIHLQVANSDDLVIEENQFYAYALLKNFFQTKQIALNQYIRSKKEDPEYLVPVSTSENNDTLTAQYELSYDVKNKKIIENVEISAQLGKSDHNRLIIKLLRKKGNAIYYKRVAKEIKKVFAYCLK